MNSENWPPIKAWTSKFSIKGQRYFVAINYGGNLRDRWVILISVLDSNVILDVSWIQLLDQSKWSSGWDENKPPSTTRSIDIPNDLKISIYNQPSRDSGLTIPITKGTIRPWFSNG